MTAQTDVRNEREVRVGSKKERVDEVYLRIEHILETMGGHADIGAWRMSKEAMSCAEGREGDAI